MRDWERGETETGRRGDAETRRQGERGDEEMKWDRAGLTNSPLFQVAYNLRRLLSVQTDKSRNHENAEY